MKKMFKIAWILVLIAGVVYLGRLVSDRQTLEQELVRLHVVAASDSQEDQTVKLLVRDAVLEYLDSAMAEITRASDAKTYIQEHLDQISQVANRALEQLGAGKTAVVTFLKEEFSSREYDTFSLPSGIYDSLRIVIGEGEGHNWWCVVFPKLCYGAAVEDVTVSAGFSQELTDTITGNYQVRFYLLDLVGKVQNFFHRG